MQEYLRLNNVLRDIIEFLNDIADFEAHGAILLEEKSDNKVARSWHHLTSFKKVRTSWLKQLDDKTHPFWVALKTRKTQLQTASLRVHKTQNATPNPLNRIWVPLVQKRKTIGAFFLDAKLDRPLSSDVRWLCENIIQLGIKTLIDEETAKLWEEMRFGILHRKSFFSLNPGVDELLDEYLNRCFLLLPRKGVQGNVRIVEPNQFHEDTVNGSLMNGSLDVNEISLVFRAQKHVPKSVWKKLYDTGPSLSVNIIDKWHRNSLKKISSKMKDPDETYFDNFPKIGKGSHIVLPSICEDRIVALFSFDSLSMDVFTKDSILAVAILAAHAASVIANAISRSKMEEQQKWLTILHDLGASLRLRDLNIEEIFIRADRSITQIGKADATNMLLFKNSMKPEIGLDTNLELAYSNLGIEFDKHINPRKHGLTAEVIKSRRPLFVDNPKMPPGIHPEAKKRGIKSYICLPMIVQEAIIGVLFVHYNKPQFFRKNKAKTATMLARLSLCANLAAAAIKNTRLIQGLEVLSHDIEQSTYGLFHLDDILDSVCKEVQSLMGFDFVALQLIRPDEKIIETVHATGIATEWSSLARHYLEKDPALRDIQADVALSRPPALEIVSGWHDLFDPYLYLKHGHSSFVRAFVPMVLVHDVSGTIDTEWYARQRWKQCPPRSRNQGRGKALKIEMEGFDKQNPSQLVDVIGTIEAGFADPASRITVSDAIQIVKLVARRTIDIYKALLPSVLKTLVERAMQIIGADSASLHYLYAPQSQSYLHEVHTGRQLDRHFLKKYPPRADGLGFEAMRDGVIKFIPDFSKGHDDDYLKIYNPGIYACGIRSMAALPLIVTENEKSVLYVHFRHLHRFTLDEIGWVKLFANQAAHAIHHALIYEQRRDRTLQLEALNSVAHSLVTTTQESDFLQDIAWDIYHLFGADLVIIYIVNIYEYTALKKRIKTPPVIAGKTKVAKSMDTPVTEHNAPVALIEKNNNEFAEDASHSEIMNSPEHRHADESKKYLSFVKREKIKSSAGILLKVENQTVGVMFMNYRRHHKFSEEEKKIIETVASWVGIAIRNRKLLEALNAVDRDIITTFDHKELLSLIVKLAAEITNAEIGDIRLPNELDPQSIEVHARHPLQVDGDDRMYDCIHIKEGITGWVAKQKKAALVNDVLKDKRYKVCSKKTRSELCVPLLDKENHLLGVLNVESQRLNAFTTAHQSLLETLADRAVIAIQNVRQCDAMAGIREQAWKDFSANTAHRMGTEAANITGALRWLKKDLGKNAESGEISINLNRIEGALKRISGHVNQFTQFDTPPTLSIEWLDANQLLKEAKTMTAISGTNAIKIRLHLSKKLPKIKADREKLLYAMKEMFQNAVKAMPQGGELKVLTCPQKGRSGIRIEFIDSGPGVSKSSKEKIFEPGFRERSGGCGLGLAIVSQTIQQHKGKIREIGVAGQGAHFVIELPANKEKI